MTINYRTADPIIDAIDADIKARLEDVDPDDALYILATLDDVVSNIIFDRTPKGTR